MAQLIGAAPRYFGKQRGVQVDAAVAGRGQRGRREDLPIVADHQQIGLKARQPRQRLPAS